MATQRTDQRSVERCIAFGERGDDTSPRIQHVEYGRVIEHIASARQVMAPDSYAERAYGLAYGAIAQCSNARVETFGVCKQLLRRVALRIHGHEQGDYPTAVVPQRLQGSMHGQ